MNMKNFLPVVVAVFVIAGIGLYSSAYVVDETQQVVVTFFEGKVVGDPIREPGLHFKIPLVHKANYFPKNLLRWDGEPGQIPTRDKTYIMVDTFARWRIVDPVAFFETIRDIESALARLDDIIDPAVRNVITDYRLIEAVRKSDRKLDTFDTSMEDGSSVSEEPAVAPVHLPSEYNITVGREKIMEKILVQAEGKMGDFGIQIMDVKIKRINYQREVEAKVYDRMIAERKQMAEMIRSEGKGEAQKILGEKDMELKQILSEAYMISQKIMGEADAEAAITYSEAYGTDPEFYSFVKTLEIYREALGKDSRLVLSTDSEFLKYLKGIPAP